MTKFEIISERLNKIAYVLPSEVAPTVQILIDDARWLRDEYRRLRDFVASREAA